MIMVAYQELNLIGSFCVELGGWDGQAHSPQYKECDPHPNYCLYPI